MPERAVVKDRSWRGRWRSFGHASRGLKVLVVTQMNARVHLALSIGAVALGLYLQLTPGEWLWIIAATGLVWVAEAFNTALEFLVDLVSPQRQPLARDVKDLAAGAVLAAAVTAAAIGCIIFGPKLWPVG